MCSSTATLMAFDYGARRIGVAVGQTISQTAEPLSVVRQNHGQIDWFAIEKIIAEWRPDSLIVGFPVTADGRRTAIHDAIDRFANGLRKRFELPVEYCDEHLSSYEASQSLDSSRHDLDALAAQVILQTWLQNHR